MVDRMDKNIYVNILLALSFFYFFSIGFDARAFDTMRCGNELVKLGNSTSTVRNRCGEPISISDAGSKTTTRTRGTVRGVGNRIYRTRSKSTSTTRYIEDWEYCIRIPRSNNCTEYILRFENNSLKKISLGDLNRRR